MRFLLIAALTLASLAGTGAAAIAGATAQKESAPLDLGFTLPAPADLGHRQYLGLDTDQPFTLDQVKADILIVEIFSMYCPICQREAPKVNTLYQRIGQIKGKTIRLMGIGAGNSDFETQYFKKTYNIEFPLFSDGEFKIHKRVGEKGTPFFIGFKPGAPKGSRIFFTHSGDITDLDQFVDRLLETAK